MSEQDSEQDRAADPFRFEDGGLLARYEAAAGRARTGQAKKDSAVPDLLCPAVVEVLPVDGAAISLYLGADIAVPVGASDSDAARAESLQFSLREGPCFSAYASRRPTAIPDTAPPRSPARSSWPNYTAELGRHTPYRAVFAYPLVLDGSAMGSLSVYRRAPGRSGVLADLTAITALTTTYLVEAGTFGGLDGDPGHRWIDAPATEARKRVWVAQGEIMLVNKLNAAEALDVLRAQAYSAGRLVDAVADDIVAGRLPVPVLADQ
jgi:hypothetical protein